ncbi:MAG TPA: DUF4136 domain-containing protein [Cyclobacteriaceae bacterium]|nr:DUF4136 domain-containing protein [Cyclobacteriaceae bacterium]
MKTRFCLPMSLVIFICSCAPQVKIVGTKPAEGTSLNNYKTFDFYQFNTEVVPSPTFNLRTGWLKDEIAKQLNARGLSQSSDNPDLLVNIGVVIEEKVQTRETTIRDAPMYTGQRNYSWQSQEVAVGTYEEGTVTIDLVDRMKNEMIWEGVASSILVKSDESSKKNIAQGMEALFAKIK